MQQTESKKQIVAHATMVIVLVLAFTFSLALVALAIQHIQGGWNVSY